jgi:hypothetical protein
VFIGIALVDKNATLMKTYPFRTSTLSSLLFILEVALIFKHYGFARLYQFVLNHIQKFNRWANRKRIAFNVFNTFLMLTMLLSLTPKVIHQQKERKKIQDGLDAGMLNLIDYCHNYTPQKAVFLFLDSDVPFSFIRRAERERFAVEKFTPTKSQAIYEWYNRLKCKENLRKNISLIDSVNSMYSFEFLISDSVLTSSSLSIERKFGSHFLYKVK